MRLKALIRYSALAAVLAFSLAASEHHGIVRFGTVPVPGATVTATQGDKKFVAITGQDGVYAFEDLPDGVWNIQVDMLTFAPVKKEIGISPSAPAAEWELKLLSMDEIKPSQAPAPAPSTTATSAAGGAAPTAGSDKAPSIVAANAASASAKPPAKGSKKGNTKGGGAAANPQAGFQRAAVNATNAGAAAPPPDNGGGGSLASASDATNSGASEAMVVNGSASTGIERRAIGNFRRGPGSLYTTLFSTNIDNSVLDARSYSIGGVNTPKPYTNSWTPNASIQGPLLIPHLFRWTGNFFFSYSGNRTRTANTQSALFPTELERKGDFSQSLNALGQPVTLYDPNDPTQTRQIPGNNITNIAPISPQAQALLNLYPLPLPALAGRHDYNYQAPIVRRNSSDQVQARIIKPINQKNTLNGVFAYQNTRNENPNIFNFIDSGSSSGVRANVTWRHMFSRQLSGFFTYNFARQGSDAAPFFANRVNVAGLAGIIGPLDQSNYWGPPGLGFSNGIQGLSDGTSSFSRNQTQTFTTQMTFIRRPHNMTFGADYTARQGNLLSQTNPQGNFQFTGGYTQGIVNGVLNTNTGSGFADFLLGHPDTSAIAYGNADKYLRSGSYDAYFQDDWRISSVFTLNAGVRWEYNSPLTEKYGRLVNLDVVPGFGAASPVLASDPVGPLTGMRYPDSMIHPDKRGFQPRISFAWHPFFGASTVVRGGYSIGYDTAAYNGIVQQLYQQAPLSSAYSITNTCLLTLQNALSLPQAISQGCLSKNTATNTFAVDPNFRPGYAQNFQLSVQQNLTGSLLLTATYLGVKGTHNVQAFLPCTYPAGSVIASTTCVAGLNGLPAYAYMASNANSTMHSAKIELRRRFHGGFTTGLTYVYSKAIDDAANLGGGGGAGSPLAQDWLNLNHERGLSSFDQRHLLNFQMQYTTGVGVHGGALMSGWRGQAFKGWSLVTNVKLGSGLPLTPVYSGTAVGRTGVTGTLRPEYTGADVYAAPAGLFLNPQAYVPPPAGQWGNAGRYSIIGPYQFTIVSTLQRSFENRFDVSFNANNPLNHVTYASWVTNISSQQFGGLPSSASNMRSISARVQVRF